MRLRKSGRVVGAKGRWWVLVGGQIFCVLGSVFGDARRKVRFGDVGKCAWEIANQCERARGRPGKCGHQAGREKNDVEMRHSCS